MGEIGRILGQRSYRLYFAGNTLSILGVWIHRTAIGWLTWELTHSPAWLGIIGFSATFPVVIVAPFAGALGDRFGVRRVAIWALLVNGANVTVFTGLLVAGQVNVAVILVSTLIMGLAFGFDLPARAALVPQIVERRHLSLAIALNTTMFHVGMFVGPALFAALSTTLDIAWAFALNAASYFVYARCLGSIRVPEAGGRGAGLLSEIVEGMRYTLAHKGILTLLLLGSAVHLGLRPYVDLLPGFSAEVFGQGAEGYASMLSAAGLGALLAGIWLSLRGRMDGLGAILLTGVPGTATSLFVFALTDLYWLGLICMFSTGFFLMTQAVASQSLVQNAAEPQVRARVISLSMAIALGFPALGALIEGYIAEFTGVQAPVLVASVLVICVWAWLGPRLRATAPSLESVEPKGGA